MPDPDAMVNIPAITQVSQTAPESAHFNESEADAMAIDDPYEGTTPMGVESGDDIHIARRDQVDIDYAAIAGYDLE